MQILHRKIVTGMLAPTKGNVVIRTEEAGVGAHAALGVCPQQDVLFEYMTAREHVALYAQLKSGLGADDVIEEVDRSVLSTIQQSFFNFKRQPLY